MRRLLLQILTTLLLSLQGRAETPPAALHPYHVRIVDFGSKLGSGFYRGTPSRAYPPLKDRDGNGTLSNDSVSAWAFSATIPLNAPGLDYDVEAKSAIFYGGLTLYKVNNPKRPISEGHTNQNHEFYDDLNFMALGTLMPNEKLEGYAVWFWQKQDFLNGGSTNRVSFDESSKLSVQISRYWGGIEAGRWMVREGDRYYLSKATFANEDRAFYVGMPQEPDGKQFDGANNPVVHRTQTLSPLSTSWAEYQPREPFLTDFDATHASFGHPAFSNITAVGFFASRQLSEPKPAAKALLLDEPIAVKWNAFRCDAVVVRPETPSFSLSMTPISGTSTAAPAFVSPVAVPFALWKQVWRHAVTRQYCQDRGDLSYVFLKDGSMGTMRADLSSHTATEPVTDITWLDAILFCNALSEQEGLTPAYYTDAGLTNILRKICDRDCRERWAWRPAVFWDPHSEGYRLPLAGELQSGPGAGFSSTAAWLYVWDQEGTSCPGEVAEHRVVSAHPGVDIPGDSPLPFGEHPWNGRFDLGFTVARRPPATVSAVPPARLASWSIRQDSTLPPRHAIPEGEARVLVERLMPLVVITNGLMLPSTCLDRLYSPSNDLAATPRPMAFGKTEVSYRLWNLVRQWAEQRGYTFNYSGDMGNMASPSLLAHTADEPVTMISLADAMVWCNALSELMGRTPVYYNDEAATAVYRQTLPFRLEMFQGPGYPGYPFKKSLPPGHHYDSGSYVPIYLKGDATGFRLPAVEEWTLANQPAATPATVLQYEWLAGNSGGQTHPVGSLKPNRLGLCDMEGNVIELMWGNTAGSINVSPVRLGGYFYRDYRSRHPRLDVPEFSAVGRSHCGFRVMRLP